MQERFQAKTAWAVTVRYLDRAYWREHALHVRASNPGLAADRALQSLKADGHIPKGTRLQKITFNVFRLAEVNAKLRDHPAVAGLGG